MDRPLVSVAIFAYNEQALISRALDCMLACRDEAELVVHVLVNGSTDRTEAIVRARAEADPAVRLVLIRRGDKANAWNHYVHEVAPENAAIHVFTDGDMEVSKGSVAAFLAAFAAKPMANACAGVPLSGRQGPELRRRIQTLGEMYGNLYALRGAFVRRVRAMGVRLPFGIFGEDGLVAALVKCDLDPRQPQTLDQITWADGARYWFQALSPFSLESWRIYRNRRRRYAVRWQQARMIWDLLGREGISAMPAHVVDLYRRQQHLLIARRGGLETLFDWEARRRIARDIAADDAVKAEERAHLYS